MFEAPEILVTTPYDPADAYWIVGDRTDYWSSKLGAYVSDVPSGFSAAHAVDEQSLSELLSANGVKPNKQPIPQVPHTITPTQARRALKSQGIDADAMIAAVNDEATRFLLQTKWEYSIEIYRDDPDLVAMLQGMGMTATQIDGLFVLAASA